MTKVTYEIVEHDGGWAYRFNGVFSETSRPTTWRTERPSVQRGNKSFRETRRASRTKTRMVIGTTRLREAMTDLILM
jgi:hypothetical protein